MCWWLKMALGAGRVVVAGRLLLLLFLLLLLMVGSRFTESETEPFAPIV